LDGAALGRLCLPCRCAVAQRCAAPADPQLRHGARLQVPHRAGRSLSRLGQVHLARPRLLALSLSTLRPAVGARAVEKADPARRPATHQLMSARRASTASVLLDALRGLAAFAVVLGHWRSALFVDLPDLPRYRDVLRPVYWLTTTGREAV